MARHDFFTWMQDPLVIALGTGGSNRHWRSCCGASQTRGNSVSRPPFQRPRESWPRRGGRGAQWHSFFRPSGFVTRGARPGIWHLAFFHFLYASMPECLKRPPSHRLKKRSYLPLSIRASTCFTALAFPVNVATVQVASGMKGRGSHGQSSSKRISIEILSGKQKICMVVLRRIPVQHQPNQKQNDPPFVHSTL